MTSNSSPRRDGFEPHATVMAGALGFAIIIPSAGTVSTPVARRGESETR